MLLVPTRHNFTALLLILIGMFQSRPVLGQETIEKPDFQIIKNSIIFIFKDGADPCAVDSRILPIGTGFVVGLADKSKPNLCHRFVITNAHVLESQHKIVLRMNNSANSGTVCRSISVKENAIFPSNKSIDLAAIPIGNIADTNLTALDYSYMLDESHMKKAEIDEGTDIVAAGYLDKYAGFSKNFPVLRFGKIALLTNEHWWNSPRGTSEKGYLVEIYNVGGSSGSPVVLQPSQIKVNSTGQIVKRRMQPFLIGIIKGHPNTVANLIEINPTTFAASTIENKYAWVSSGVAVLEPAESLQEFLMEIASQLEKLGMPTILNQPFSTD